MWITWNYYNENFLLGRPPIISEQEFEAWAKKAEVTINRRKLVIKNAPDLLRDAVCEVAEFLFVQGKTDKEVGELLSESNNGYSWSREPRENRIKNSKIIIRNIITEYLRGTHWYGALGWSVAG